MRQELQNIEYIERYLEDSLSQADKRKFEQHLKEDAQFRAAVNLQRQLVTQVKEQAFLKDIALQHTTFIAQEQQQKQHFWWLLPIGSLLVLALVGAWWYNQQPAPVEETVTALTQEVLVAPILSLGQAPELLAPALQAPYTIEQRSANRTATITFQGTASTLTIPKRSLVNAAGEVITGTYEVQYRSLNNPAAMATAGFPLLTSGDQAQGIASVGAFEVRAFQKGAPLFVATGKTLVLDYELKERVQEAALYHLEEENRTWQASEQTLVLPKKGAYDKVVDSIAFKEAKRIYEASLKAANPAPPQRRKDTLDAGSMYMMPEGEGLEKLSDATPPQPNQYLVRHYKNPKLVRALRLGSFGVYNCGKAYHVKNQVVVAAQYTNEQKVVIENARTLSVIDLDYKAAYSFQPDQFICNSQANNVFLLWTQAGSLYAFIKKAEVNLQTGTYSFQMENLSERVQSSRDLKLYLERLQNVIDR